MLRTTLLAIVLTLLSGCGESTAPAKDEAEPKTETTGTNRESVEAEEPGSPLVSEDVLAVPQFEPAPVQWFEEWERNNPDPPEKTTERENAETGRMFADSLKSNGNYAGAEKLYLEVLRTDPTYAFAAYQLACNYELWGKHDDAVRCFEQALELDFYDFPTALSDDELGKIRKRPEFPRQLRILLDRYRNEVTPGTPLAVRPESEMPEAGYPVMLLLHGKGDSHLAWVENAQRWADMGFLAVAVPGSVPSGDGRYSWMMETTTATHRELQAIVTSELLEPLIDHSRVFLLGFSLGAMHGMVLVMDYPEEYRGVVAISPGGLLVNRLVRPEFSDSISGRVMLVYGTQEVHGQLVSVTSVACRNAGWKFRARSHPGGHHFPDSWDEMVLKIPAFLLEE